MSSCFEHYSGVTLLSSLSDPYLEKKKIVESYFVLNRGFLALPVPGGRDHLSLKSYHIAPSQTLSSLLCRSLEGETMKYSSLLSFFVAQWRIKIMDILYRTSFLPFSFIDMSWVVMA